MSPRRANEADSGLPLFDRLPTESAAAPAPAAAPPVGAERVYRVAEVSARLANAVRGEFPDLMRVEGEISNLRRQSPSGHLYFSLKDADAPARLDAVWFRMLQSPFAYKMADGQQVRVLGQIGIYEPKSGYQIRVRAAEPAGRGALFEALERLKARLAAEGLFDPSRKRPLPVLPRCIGVATSPSGAALRDVLNVLARRFPTMRVLVSPCRVQGDGAAADIAAAIDRFRKFPEVEVILVVRGGGSIEDLWPFNEEAVVRAIARASVPVIAGVGHETDVTLADFAADRRAPTPSAAAEMAVAPREEFEQNVRHLWRRMIAAARRTTDGGRARLRVAAAHPLLRAPRQTLRDWRRRVADAAGSVSAGLRDRVIRYRQRLDDLSARGREALRTRLGRAVARAEAFPAARLSAAMVRAIEDRRRACRHFDARLRALGPDAVLRRGYSLTLRPDGSLVTRAADVCPGDELHTRLADGEIASRATAVRAAAAEPPDCATQADKE